MPLVILLSKNKIFAPKIQSMMFALILNSQLAVEVPPLATVPFPPPLDEGMTEEMWREHVMTPPQSPQPEEQKEVRIKAVGPEGGRLPYEMLVQNVELNLFIGDQFGWDSSVI